MFFLYFFLFCSFKFYYFKKTSKLGFPSKGPPLGGPPGGSKICQKLCLGQPNISSMQSFSIWATVFLLFQENPEIGFPSKGPPLGGRPGGSKICQELCFGQPNISSIQSFSIRATVLLLFRCVWRWWRWRWVNTYKIL